MSEFVDNALRASLKQAHYAFIHRCEGITTYTTTFSIILKTTNLLIWELITTYPKLSESLTQVTSRTRIIVLELQRLEE